MSFSPALNKCTLHSFADNSFFVNVKIYTCVQDSCRKYDFIKSFRKHLRTRHPIRSHLRVQVMENALLAENVIGVNHDNAPINGNPPMSVNENVYNNLQENDVEIR